MDEKEIIAKIKLLRKIQPDKNWLVFCRQELVRETLEKKEQSPVFSPRPTFFTWLLKNKPWLPLFRPAVVALSIIIILGFGGLVTVKAALNSLPGDWLYPIKISLERAQIKLVSDETEKAELEAKMTGRRAQELTEIVNQPSSANSSVKEEKIEQAVQQIKLQLSTAQEQLPKLKEKAITKADSEKLKAMAKTVKENTAKLEEAISQAKNNLSENLSENKTLSAKISDISDMAKENNSQVLEILETVENLDTLNIPTESESTSSPSLKP